MNLLIAIDPDIDKSGVAVAQTGRLVSLSCLRFFDIVEYFRHNRYILSDVIIEAGWLNKKSNYHPAWGPARREKIAKNVGMNHAVGRLLAEVAEGYCINVRLYQPVTSKVDAATFKRLTGWEKRTNQEMRDAGMILVNLGVI